jgi:hypothetical protein
MKPCVRQKEGKLRERVAEFILNTAKVLGSLAEVYLAMGQKDKAVKILHTY